MSNLRAHTVTNASVYLDGNSYMGQCEEVDLGSVKTVMTDFQGLGMAGAIELPAGFEKIEGKIVWNSLYRDAAAQCAVPFASVQLQLRSSVNAWGSQGRMQELPMVTLMTVLFKEYQLGSFKPNDPVKFETPFSALYVQQKIDGREVFLLDCLANIFRVGGVDQLAKYRANLGMN